MPINAIEHVYMRDTSLLRLEEVQDFCLQNDSRESIYPSQRETPPVPKEPDPEDAQKRAEIRKLLSRVVSLQDYLKTEIGLRLVNVSATQAKIVDALGETWQAGENLVQHLQMRPLDGAAKQILQVKLAQVEKFCYTSL